METATTALTSIVVAGDPGNVFSVKLAESSVEHRVTSAAELLADAAHPPDEIIIVNQNARTARRLKREFPTCQVVACTGGLCGSGICADEKFKRQQNGNVHRYVYYGCTKARDKDCKCGYLEEKELLKQFEDLLDKIDLDEIGIKEKIRTEVERFKKFQQVALCTRETVAVTDIDIRNYAKYLLRGGTIIEKRELLGCLKTKLVLTDRKLTLGLANGQP